jgi:hypothetical protein
LIATLLELAFPPGAGAGVFTTILELEPCVAAGIASVGDSVAAVLQAESITLILIKANKITRNTLVIPHLSFSNFYRGMVSNRL